MRAFWVVAITATALYGQGPPGNELSGVPKVRDHNEQIKRAGLRDEKGPEDDRRPEDVLEDDRDASAAEATEYAAAAVADGVPLPVDAAPVDTAHTASTPQDAAPVNASDVLGAAPVLAEAQKASSFFAYGVGWRQRARAKLENSEMGKIAVVLVLASIAVLIVQRALRPDDAFAPEGYSATGQRDSGSGLQEQLLPNATGTGGLSSGSSLPLDGSTEGGQSSGGRERKVDWMSPRLENQPPPAERPPSVPAPRQLQPATPPPAGEAAAIQLELEAEAAAPALEAEGPAPEAEGPALEEEPAEEADKKSRSKGSRKSKRGSTSS